MRTTITLIPLLLLGCTAEPKDDTGVDTGPFSDADEDGWATHRDCNDHDASIHPEAEEICDGVDNDCDEAVDEDVKVTVWADADGDGYGDPHSSGLACGAGDGWVDDQQDCDDGDPRAHPGAQEICNRRDDDCDGAVDEEPIDGQPFHVDADGDGYGDPAATAIACAPGQGLVDNALDCHDDDPAAFPGSEAWEHPEDGVDQDCDGFDGSRDLDGDGLCDLVFASYRDEDTWLQQSPVYFGNEEGFSEEHATWLDTAGALGMLARDLDGDGRPELVMGAYYDDTTASYEQDAVIYWGREGGPSPEHSTALPTRGGLDLTAADLDLDGYDELIFSGYYASGSYEGLSRVFWSQGPSWSPERYTDLDTVGAYHVEAGDLDGDGWTDLVFAGRYGPEGYDTQATVVWNRGGSLDSSEPLALPITCSTHLVLADFDADGWMDIALAAFRSDDNVFELDSRVYTGSATGFDAERYTALPTAGAFAMASDDLDKDGFPELVVANYRDDETVLTTSTVYWGSSGGLSAEHSTALPTNGTRDVEIADLDGDGWLDLAFASYYGETGRSTDSLVYWGSATGFSEEARSALPTDGAFRVRAGDVDHDGWQDLVFGSYYGVEGYSTEAAIYYGSPGGFSEEHRELLPVVGAWTWPLLVGAD